MSRFVFMSNCILSQSVMAEGASKTDKSMVRMVIDWALDNDINIQQMPCPESILLGVDRAPHGYKWYKENEDFEDICKSVARNQVKWMKTILDGGHEIIGVIGVIFSPACSTIKDSPSPYHPYGLYMERLEFELKKRDLKIPFISVTPKWEKKSMEKLNSLISKQEVLFK